MKCAFTLTYSRFHEAAAHREKARAEVVDQKLKVVEDVAKALVPPESMSSFKVGK